MNYQRIIKDPIIIIGLVRILLILSITQTINPAVVRLLTEAITSTLIFFVIRIALKDAIYKYIQSKKIQKMLLIILYIFVYSGMFQGLLPNL